MNYSFLLFFFRFSDPPSLEIGSCFISSVLSSSPYLNFLFDDFLLCFDNSSKSAEKQTNQDFFTKK